MQTDIETFRSKLKGKILYLSREDKGDYEIYMMQANGTDRVLVAAFPVEEIICFVGWSPDGKQIVFTSRRSGNYDIYTMNADGSQQKRLTYTRSTTYGRAWSPDGKHLAFTSTQPGTEEVYMINTDGTGQKRITTTAYVENGYPKAYNKNPSWSPDGRQIVFASARSGNQEIFIMNADGSEPKQLTDSEGMKEFPCWSPDGKHIAFTHYGYKGVCVMNMDGSNLRSLTDPVSIPVMPSWSPDGQYIVYQAHINKDMDLQTNLRVSEICVVEVASEQSIRLTETNRKNEYPSWID